MARALPALLAAALALFAARAPADDLAHVSAEELAAELAAREADIARTGERLRQLERGVAAAEDAVAAGRTEALEIDRALAERAGLLYRLGRRGAAFRYLLAAPSAGALVKRYATLRRLFVGLLEARRDAGERLVEAEAALADARRELQLAGAMLSQLEEARDEILAEIDRRAGRALAWR